MSSLQQGWMVRGARRSCRRRKYGRVHDPSGAVAMSLLTNWTSTSRLNAYATGG